MATLSTQNPYAAAGADPNAELFKAQALKGAAVVQTPTGGTYQTLKPTSSVASTSDAATNFVNNLGNNINSATAPVIPTVANPSGTPAAPGQFLQYNGTYASTPDPYGFGTIGYNPATETTKIFQDRQKALDIQREQEISRLTGEQAREEAKLETTQKGETATSARNLAYLQQGGTSASASAYLNSLEVSHRSEMGSLVAKYNSAIQQAKNAYADKDFALAEKMAEAAKDIKNDAITRNNNFLTYTSNLRKEQSDAAKAKYQQQKDTQDFVVAQGISKPFYFIGGQIKDSNTGETIDYNTYLARGGDATLGNVQVIDPGSKAEKDYVKDLATKYADAGIKLTDNAEVAQSKLQGSKIYREQVRPPISGSGGGSLSSTFQERYNIPSYIKENEFNTVRDYILAKRLESSGVDSATLIKTISDTLLSKGIDPTIYEGLIWEQLVPVKNDKTGYEQWRIKVGKDTLKNPINLTGDQVTSIARSYVKSLSVPEAKSIINSGQIQVNGKMVDLSQKQIDDINAKIDSEYPAGRTTWEKILPGGK